MSIGAAWQGHWLGPVAPVRPRLLQRGVLVLLAFDAWLLCAPDGGRYGADGFNAAHFAWLDALQPDPTPALYVGVMLSVGLLALVAAAAPRRWIITLVTLLWTWGWAMSLLDGYQHHYFLSLVLLALVFFPIQRPGAGAREGEGSWAHTLLGATVAIVYAFAALAKLDAPWRSGWTLQQVEGVRDRLLPLVSALRGAGLPEEAFWGMLGHGAVALELTLAVGYAAAPRLDRGPGRALRALRWAALACALALHGGAELLGLRVGWFSYYMLLFAALYFLPAPWLAALAARVARVPGDRARAALGAAGAVRGRPRRPARGALTATLTRLPQKATPLARLPGEDAPAPTLVCSTNDPLGSASGLRFMDTPSVLESDEAYV